MTTFQNRTHSRGFTSLQTTFRTTNFVFKKSRPHFDIQINGLPTFHSLRTTLKDRNQVLKIPERKNPELKIQPNSEISCTNFMKSYIDKLKKQRKRHNKKLKETKGITVRGKESRQKGKQFSNFSQEQPLYNQPKSNHILILEKIPRAGTRGYMNTISLVSENLDELNQSSEKKQGKYQSPEWAKKQKLDKLIKDIRNSRKKNSAIDYLSEKPHKFFNAQENKDNEDKFDGVELNLHKNVRFAKVKGSKGKKQNDFKKLEPWKPQLNQYEFSIQEYNKD